MRFSTIMFLVIAIFAGAMAALGARRFISSQVAGNQQAMKMVVVATRNLGYGAELQSEFLGLKNWPASVVPSGSFQSLDQLTGSNKRYVLSTIQSGEPIVQSRITAPGQRPTLSTLISENMRAVTIRVDDVRGVAGFVMPGDKVDVAMTRQDRSDVNKSYVEVLLQNVKVLAIDQSSADRSTDRKDGVTVAKAVTVEVTPQQAQKLLLGSQFGTLSLVLRQVSNSKPANTTRVTVADLGGGEYVRPDEGNSKLAELEKRLEELKKIAEAAKEKATSTASEEIKRLEALLKQATNTRAVPQAAPMPSADRLTKVRIYRGSARGILTEDLNILQGVDPQ